MVNFTVVNLFQNNIQTVLNITGGLFGVIIMMALPSLLVILGRKKLKI